MVSPVRRQRRIKKYEVEEEVNLAEEEEEEEV